MISKSIVVFKKELRETVRDKRSVSLFLFLIILYPAMLWMLFNQIIVRANAPDREHTEIVLIGAEKVPTLVAQLEQKNISVASHGEMTDSEITALLAQQKVTTVLKIGPDFTENYQQMRPARIEIWYDSATEQQAKQRRVESVLRNYTNSIASARLLAHGVSPATLMPIQLQDYDTASGASRSAKLVGSIMGMMFVFSFMFCMNAVMDMTAGERERRSLEILMVQPVSPLQLILGKWLAAALISFVGITCELIAMHFLLKVLPLEEIGMSWRLELLTLVGVCLASFPLCLFAAGAEIALALNARTFKEAQTMMSFAIMVPMLPILVVPMLDLNTETWMYAVPILANQTLLMELSKGSTVNVVCILLTILSSLAPALISVAFASWRLGSERYVINV